MTESTTAIIEPQYAGQRLEQVLRAFFPFLGIRGAKRAVKTGRVSLNGKRPLPATRVKCGDRLDFLAPLQISAGNAGLLGTSGPYTFLYKPAHMHCARLSGGNNVSLEEMLEQLSPEPLRLLQRLDYGTSGIVLASGDPEGASQYRLAQEAGACQKYYLALLCGELPGEIIINNYLDTSRRKKTRILATPGARQTILWPLRHWRGQLPDMKGAAMDLSMMAAKNSITLALCGITKGARHQIRAHAAHAGFPLLGDGLYNPAAGGDNFFLHQALLAFNGHFHINLPNWLPAGCEEMALKTLNAKLIKN